MPQLDLFTFTSQFFWLSFAFWSLYTCVFLNFVLPFAFILKTKEYLYLQLSNSLFSTLVSDKSINIIKSSFSTLNFIALDSSKKFGWDLNVLQSVLRNSILALRFDTNFEVVRAYLALSGLTNHLLSNRSIPALSKIGGLSRTLKKPSAIESSLKGKKVETKNIPTKNTGMLNNTKKK